MVNFKPSIFMTSFNFGNLSIFSIIKPPRESNSWHSSSVSNFWLISSMLTEASIKYFPGAIVIMSSSSSVSYSSEICPTIFSIMSSKVIMPSVPPYSSVTMATDNLFCRISEKSVPVGLYSKVKKGFLKKDLFSARGFVLSMWKISFTFKIPIILSKLSS